MGKNRLVKRGDIWLVSLDGSVGTQVHKTQPCIIVQNNVANMYSPRTIVVPITSQKMDDLFPGEFLVLDGKLCVIKFAL
jgi:mRNA interferase MazF